MDLTRLIEKLEEARVRGHAKRWFEYYITSRYQYVMWYDCSSTHRKVTKEVPQGSVLSSTLFIMYINDIGMLWLKGRVTTFVDDATITYSYYGAEHKEVRNTMQKGLNTL